MQENLENCCLHGVWCYIVSIHCHLWMDANHFTDISTSSHVLPCVPKKN